MIPLRDPVTERKTSRVVLREVPASLLKVVTSYHQELTGRENA
jgi:hypothetical protein